MEAAACDEQPWMDEQSFPQTTHTFLMSDCVLRAGVAPAMDVCQHRLPGDAQNRREIGGRDSHQFGVAQIHCAWIVCAADERAEKHRLFRRATIPLRRDPGARGDTNRICRLATTNPVPDKEWATACFGHASAIAAVETYGTCAHNSAACGSTVRSNSAAADAGAATTTTGAVSVEVAVETLHPEPVRFRRVAPSRYRTVCGGTAASSASMRLPIPDLSATNPVAVYET